RVRRAAAGSDRETVVGLPIEATVHAGALFDARIQRFILGETAFEALVVGAKHGARGIPLQGAAHAESRAIGVRPTLGDQPRGRHPATEHRRGADANTATANFDVAAESTDLRFSDEAQRKLRPRGLNA